MFFRTLDSMTNAKSNDLLTLALVTFLLLAAIVTTAAQFVSVALAGEADVVAVTAERQAEGTWRFDVTVKHADTGWDHYADRWDVIGPNGTVLGERVLLHPHVEEQPFTRSLRGVLIPEDFERVIVRAHDSVHGLGGQEMTVELRR
ncbi:MAG: hypothetical protein AAFR27_10465 [Pseudomonadota bacterium]